MRAGRFTAVLLVLLVPVCLLSQEEGAVDATNTPPSPDEGTVLSEEKDAEDFFNLGKERFEAGDHDAALPLFLKALNRDYSDLRIYYYLGLTYKAQGQHDNALFTFKRGLELKDAGYDPLITRIYTHMLQIYNYDGDAKKAVTLALYALKKGHKTPQILNELARAYMQEMNYRNSQKALDLSFSMDPYNPYTYNLLGLLYLKTRRYESAVTSFETAAAFESKVHFFHANLGQAYRELEQYDRALKSYQRAYELYPGSTVYPNIIRDLKKKTGKNGP